MVYWAIDDFDKQNVIDLTFRSLHNKGLPLIDEPVFGQLYSGIDENNNKFIYIKSMLGYVKLSYIEKTKSYFIDSQFEMVETGFRGNYITGIKDLTNIFGYYNGYSPTPNIHTRLDKLYRLFA